MPWARAAASSPGHTSDGRRRLMIVRTPSRARFAIPASSGCAPRNNAGFTQPKFPMPSQAGTPRGMMLQPEKISAPRKTPSNDTKRAQDKGGKGSMSRKVVVETEREEARLLIPREYKDTKKTEWIVHCAFLDSNSLPDPFSNSNSGSTVKRVNRSSPKPLPLKIQDPTKLAGARPRRPHKRVRTDLILMSPKLIYDRLVHQPELAGRVSRPQTLVDIQGSDLRFVIQRGWIEDLSGGILRGHTTHLNRNLAIEAVSLRILERSPKPTIRMSDRGRREDLVHRTMRVYHTLELHPMLQQSLMSWIGQTMRERVPSVLLAHLGGILMLVDVKRAVALRLAMRRVRQRPAARLSLVERHHTRGRQDRKI